MQWLNEVGLWLAHSAIFGAVILSAGAVAVWLCREPIYRIRIVQWTFVACLLVPAMQQLELPPSFSVHVWQAAGDEAEDAPRNAQPDSPSSYAPAPTAAPLLVNEPELEAIAHQEEPSSAKGSAVAPLRRPTTTSNTGALRLGLIRGMQIGYFVLAGLLAFTWARDLARRSAIARSATPADRRLREVLASIAGPASSEARLLVSEHIDSPVMWGLWRPTIVVPGRLAANPSASSLRWGLAHEWSHVARGDFAALLVARVAKIVCFYQPAYWWLRRQLTLSQDFLADAFAAEHGESAEDYAAFLVSLARGRQAALSGALGISDRRSNLLLRVKMLVQSSRPPRQHGRWAPSLAIILATMFAVAGLSVVRLSAEPVKDSPAAADSPESKVVKKKPQDKLPAPITYTGQVVDRNNGKPIVGATVEIIRSLSRDPKTGERKSLQTTTHQTDASGHYTFTLPPEQVVEPSLYLQVDAHHPDYQSKGRSGYSHTMIRKNLAQGDPPFYSVIKLSAGEAITAVVLEPDGAPAANIPVLVYSKGDIEQSKSSIRGGAYQHSRTDENGRLRLVVATPGDGVLWIYPKNFSPLAHRIGKQRGDIGPLRLAEGTRLTGQALDAKGKPLAHVAVNVGQQRDDSPVGEFLSANAVANAIGAGVETDDEGRFELSPLPPGVYRMEVGEYVRDPSTRERPAKLRVDDVFAPMEVTIRADEPSEPLRIQAVPHVVLRGRFFDSAGKPRASHDQHLVGKFNGGYLFKRSTQPGSDGWFEFKVPHGIEEVRVNLMTNEHSALRWRLGSEGPLRHGRRIELGTLEADRLDLEIVRYVAPILLLKAVDENGEQIRGFKPSSTYRTRPAVERSGTFISGALGDIGFEEQADGRWRSSQMLPDEEVTITLQKEGFQTEAQTVTLKEHEERELVFVMKKAS